MNKYKKEDTKKSLKDKLQVLYTKRLSTGLAEAKKVTEAKANCSTADMRKKLEERIEELRNEHSTKWEEYYKLAEIKMDTKIAEAETKSADKTLIIREMYYLAALVTFILIHRSLQ